MRTARREAEKARENSMCGALSGHSVIQLGYKLPFVSIPTKYFFCNHKSAFDKSDFVCEAVERLLLAGSVVEVNRDQVHMCRPLGVVPKKSGKFRLICKQPPVEDLRVVADLIEPGDWFFTFDLSNGYYHVDIYEEHWKYLAFSFKFKAKTHYFMFCSLPFGLSSAPYVFTKLLRPVVAHWRSDGIRISVYLDDGIGADSTYSNSLKQSDRIRKDLDSLGFLVNEVKSDF